MVVVGTSRRDGSPDSGPGCQGEHLKSPFRRFLGEEFQIQCRRSSEVVEDFPPKLERKTRGFLIPVISRRT